MIVPVELAQELNALSPQLEHIERTVKQTVSVYSESQGFAFVGRLKKADSLAEKVETGRFAGWQDLDDIYACAVIVPGVSDEAAILDFLRTAFVEVVTRGRGTTQKDPAVFRFDSTRFIGRLRSPEGSTPDNLVFRLSFEVQIRTAFEHAWSTSTHSLAYKGGRIDWRRLRLVAQLKAAVEQLDALVEGFDSVAERISEQEWPEVRAKRMVEVFFREKFASGALPSESAPSSWVRFCDNFASLVRAAKPVKPYQLPQSIEGALAMIDTELSELGPERVPRSLSLLQFCLGVLAKREYITRPLRDYVPSTSPTLLSLYPEARVAGDGFVWSTFPAAA